MGRIISCIIILLLMTALLVSVSASATRSENSVIETELNKANGAPAQVNAFACATPWEERHIVGDIYEYTTTLKVGAGEFDKIGIHRVVKTYGGEPVRTKAGVTMIPGSWQNFRAAYLLSAQTDVPEIDVNCSLAVYLAANDIDVWGIDLRRSFVPQYYPNTTVPYCNHPDSDNCSFMKDWNVSTHIDDMRTAVVFAGITRLTTGQEPGKMFMLGASRGGRLTYAYANDWARPELPPEPWGIRGVITMDIAYKFDLDTEVTYCTNYSDPNTSTTINASDAACLRYRMLQSMYDNGTYYDDTALFMKQIANSSKMDPDGTSLIIPGFTNTEVGELLLSATYLFQPQPQPPQITGFHYCTGTFNETGHPAGLNFTNSDYMIDLAQSLDTFQSIGYMMEEEAIMCNCSAVVDVPYDDNLGNISLPVLYVGGETGYGGEGNYTTSLLRSTDVTNLIVPGYGHIDISYADCAESTVWAPICDWIVNHTASDTTLACTPLMN